MTNPNHKHRVRNKMAQEQENLAAVEAIETALTKIARMPKIIKAP